MSGVELGGAIRQDTSQNLLESISDTEILNENRLSTYDVKFKDEPSSSNRSLRKTNATSSWNTLEGLQEEEKIGIDDLLLAQQLRSESPHLRLESEHRRASANARATPSPPSSPRRSKAMIGQEQRASLINARKNVLSRTPSPQGHAAEGNSPPTLRRDGSKDESPGMRRRGSSKNGSGLLSAGLRPSLTVPANSFDSDSSVEVNKELLQIHQMGSTTDEEMPYITISSDVDLPFYNKDDYDSLPKLRRKNASRRRSGSLKTRGRKEEEAKDTLFNQDGVSDLSFQPLESDLSFKPFESDLNFPQSTQNKDNQRGEREEGGEASKSSEDVTKATIPDVMAASGEDEMKTEKEVETKMEETHQSPEPSLIQEDVTPPATVPNTDDTSTPANAPGISNTPATIDDTPPAKVPTIDDTPPANVPDISDTTTAANVSSISDTTPPISVPSTDNTGTAAVPPGIDDNTPLLNEDLSDLSFSFRKSDDEEESDKFEITKNKPQATAALSPARSPQINSKPVTPPTAESVTQSPIKTPSHQSPERDTPTKSSSPRRRTLIVKSTPSQKELETPPTASPEKTKNEETTKEDEIDKTFEGKPSSSLRRKNATRLSRSPRHGSSKEEATPPTPQEGEMGTLERKRAKAREAARRLRESGQSSKYRMEGQTETAPAGQDSSLERKRAKAKEAAKRMKESGESSQSRIERDAKGEILKESLYNVEYRSDSPASLI